MTHITCTLTAKNRYQLWNPMLGNRVWATFTFTFHLLRSTAFNGLLSGTTRVGRYQKKHSPTHTHPIIRHIVSTSSIYYYNPQHALPNHLEAWIITRVESVHATEALARRSTTQQVNLSLHRQTLTRRVRLLALINTQARRNVFVSGGTNLYEPYTILLLKSFA